MLMNLFKFIVAISFFVNPLSALEPKLDFQQKTQQTNFPISNNWYWYGHIDSPDTDFWLFSKDFDPKSSLVTVWTRNYNYTDNILDVVRMVVNRKSKETKNLKFLIYDLKNGDLKFSSDDKYESKWVAAVPGSIGYAMFERLDVIEMVSNDK